jgi:GNAT superfamily N-acetyltransferase
VKVLAVAWDHPAVRQLTVAQQAELRTRYDGQSEPGTPPSAADVSVVLLAVDDDGTPLGCGALRSLGETVAEIKRMYVVPDARGRGVATTLLAALEAAARLRGWTTLRLETGPRQPEAIGLYTGAGYAPIAPFGAYAEAAEAAESLFYERVLEPSRTH